MRNRKLINLLGICALTVSLNATAKPEVILDANKVNRQQLKDFSIQAAKRRTVYGQDYEAEALGYLATGQYTYIEADPGAADSVVTPIVSNIHPSEGTQHISLLKDDAYATSGAGATVNIGTQLSIPEITDLTQKNVFSIDWAAVGGTGGADWYIRGFQNNGGAFNSTWYVDITFNNGFSVVDDIGAGAAFVDTGFAFTNGQYYNLTILTDPAAGSIEYYIDGVLIYTGVAALGSGTFLSGTVADTFIIVDDNWQNPGELADFDNIIIDDNYIAPVPDLALTKTNDSGASAAMSDTVTYTLSVENIDTGTATSPVLTDTMPAGMTYVSSSCDDTSGPGTNSAGTVTFNLDDIAAAATTTCTIVATVSDFGTHTNNASVSTTDDADATNDTATSDVVGPAEVDMSIAKTSDAAGTVAENATVVYTLTATNNDADDAANNVVVTDVLPAQVTYVSNDCGASEASGTVTWTSASIAAGANAVCNITVTVTGFGTFDNTATITADETDNTAGNNSSSTTVDGPTAVLGVDLVMSKTADAAGEQALGATVTYTLTVNNTSANDATNTIAVDSLPVGLTYVSNTCGATVSGSTVSWNIGTLAGGANTSCDIVTTVAGNGSINNTASVSSDEADNNSTDNSASALISGPPAVDVSLAKTVAASDSLALGDTIVYTLSVANINTGNATNVVVTDNLPSQVSYVSNTCGGSIAGSTFTWNVGTLNAGSSDSCNITVTISGDGNISNTASVSVAEADVNAGNDSSSAAVFVGIVRIIPTLSFTSLLLLILTLGFFGRRMLAKD